MNETIAAIATPPGTGGIAVVRVSGSQAYSICEKVFLPIDKTKNIKDAKGYTAMFGHFFQDDKLCDEVVALFFKAPKSYTGEDVVELSCHGGRQVCENLLTACIKAGAKVASAGEFTKRAFLSGRISLTQAEAVMDIIAANTKTGAAAAAAALDGALYKKINKILKNLTALVGHISAYIDYPEENVPELEQQVLEKTLTEANKDLQSLIDGYDSGSILKRGVETAIVGSPNVGKSTLLNLLSGFDRAIVTPIAGTTRDIVEQQVILAGVQLFLADTAGIRQTQDIVEAEGIKRSVNCMEKAGLVLCVFDASKPFDQTQKELAQACEGKNAIAIINKTDLEQVLTEQDILPYFKSIVYTSSKDEDSFSKIENAVSEVLQTSQIDPDTAMLANTRQLDAAVKANDAVKAALDACQMGITLDAIGVCIDDALYALYELTGENVSDAVVDEVFSQFCVGK